MRQVLIKQNMRITTIILSYRRAILIAVYTHLLCKPFPVPSSLSLPEPPVQLSPKDAQPTDCCALSSTWYR